MSLITISIVIYNPDLILLSKLFSPFKKNKQVFFVITDHSPIRFEHFELFDNIEYEYIHDKSNPGFGSGHNNAFKSSSNNSKYFLVCNPDIIFDFKSIIELTKYLDTNIDVGILMPSIIYPDGRNQKLAKLLPSPIDLLSRRVPFLKNKKYILNDYTYSFPLDVPFLSGCFMLFNANVYKLIDGFDTNYFMYFEDVDICRKVRAYNYRTVVYPFVTVIHDHEFKSLFKLNTLIYLIKSSVYYFNKWGWIFDKQKHLDNNLTISKISSLK
jgi:GT2 family glycosyltransferase